MGSEASDSVISLLRTPVDDGLDALLSTDEFAGHIPPDRQPRPLGPEISEDQVLLDELLEVEAFLHPVGGETGGPLTFAGMERNSQWSTPLPLPEFSTDIEIIDFIGRLQSNTRRGEEINLNLAEEDQTRPTAVRRYVANARMNPNQRSNEGYWKEIRVKITVRGQEYAAAAFPLTFHATGSFHAGLKRTFRFHKNNGSRSNWFMDEYIPTNDFGTDLFMENVGLRNVYTGAAVPGEPSPEEKIKKKIAAAKKHRMRGPNDLVIKRESPAWYDFIKVFDRHPRHEESKVVYAVCCHCDVVLNASTKNGTKNLLTHCNRTCPVKNKKQQPNSSGGGGCTLAEAPVQASSKRRKLVCGSSSSQRSAQPLLKELLADLVESDPSSTDIKPPTGSTDFEIIRFLKREKESLVPHGKDQVNVRLGEQDQMYPDDVRSYVTTVKMMPDQNLHDLGYWKEKEVKLLRGDESDGIGWSLCRGLKRNFQFHMNDGSETTWFTHEYVPMEHWGYDLFMKPLRFRKVYEYEVPEVKIKNKIAAGKKHRVRKPENLLIKGSEAWQHFIKIYDMSPELEGSKVAYALCCYCKAVLKAATENGTSSLLQHCKRNCPDIKNMKQQP